VHGALVHYPTVRDLLIIRHGQTHWNLEHRWQGWMNSTLTELGREQARGRADQLARLGVAPVAVHCSDLGRARDTAEIVAAVLGAAVMPHSGLRERAGGDWEGHTSEEIAVKWPGMLGAWRRGELGGPPGGEDDATVFTRFDAAIAAVVDAGVPALVVTHGGVLRLIATRAGVPEAALLPNLGGYWFDVVDGALAAPDPLPALDSATELPTAE
jgi:broad specificity phosphatase PhoE